MTNVDRYAILLARVQKQYPRFKVRKRSNSWLHPIFVVLSALTRKSYATFTTTVASTMYVGDNWDSKDSDAKYGTLRHELVHVEQFHKWPLGRWAWPLNHLIMGLCYLLVLPVFLTMRAKFEREGYTQTLLVEYELNNGPISDQRMETNARWLAETFGGSAYAWMWSRKKAYAWAMETQRAINKGDIVNPVHSVNTGQAA